MHKKLVHFVQIMRYNNLAYFELQIEYYFVKM